MDPTAPHTIVVVAHTHWDREWYQPLGVFRQRLTDLIDELLDRPDSLPFLLDGQAIVLDDYLQMRPERALQLRHSLGSGALEAGPWYVLPDLLIPSGEALTRNLLEGIRTARAAGAVPPPVLYSPDAFGHTAAGPALAAGFGFGVAIVWRGYGGGNHPDSRVARWAHPSGARVVLFALPPGGYETGAALPHTADGAAARWRAARTTILGNNPTQVALLPNGADHHARQPMRAEALAALSLVAHPHIVESDSLAGFAQRLLQASGNVQLPGVDGELRDSSGVTWSLQGTFATRSRQKRLNAQIERLVLREAEPWSALAWYLLDFDQRHTVRMLWKTLLANQPHDTICGCATDEVAAAADVRWADARAQAFGVRDRAMQKLVGYDPAAQRAHEAHWRSSVVIRNPSARIRGGVVHLRLFDAVVADPVGPGSAGKTGARVGAPPGPVDWSGAECIQLLERARQFDRVESPLHYPRNSAVRVNHGMAWIDPVAGYSAMPISYRDLGALVKPVPSSIRARASEIEIVNPTWRISREDDGVIATHKHTGAVLQPLGWIESTTDAGDTYTPSLRGAPITTRWNDPKLSARGPLRGEWETETSLQRLALSISAATEPMTREVPSRDYVTLSLSATLALHAGSDWINLRIRGENTAGDHRLRWIFPLPHGIDRDRVTADVAFGTVDRSAHREIGKKWTAEETLPTAPLHRWLWLRGKSYGIGIISDGLAEYELLPEGFIAITLLRAVGELSRRDLPERPGHAGWPMATPEAQSLGPFEANIALLTLPQDHDEAIARLEVAADDVLLPLAGETWRGVAMPLSQCTGLSLEGDGIVFSAAKRSEDGAWLVLRCLNQRDRTARATWHLPREASEVRLARLDETPGVALTGHGSRIAFDVPPHAIHTLLVR